MRAKPRCWCCGSQDYGVSSLVKIVKDKEYLIPNRYRDGKPQTRKGDGLRRRMCHTCQKANTPPTL